MIMGIAAVCSYHWIGRVVRKTDLFEFVGDRHYFLMFSYLALVHAEIPLSHFITVVDPLDFKKLL